MKNVNEEKLASLAKIIEESLVLFELITIDKAFLSFYKINEAGIFTEEINNLLQELKDLQIISSSKEGSWKVYREDNKGKEIEKIEKGWIMEVNTKKLKDFLKKSGITPAFVVQPEIKVEKGIGYFKMNKKAKKIKIGREGTKKLNLLRCLINPPGVARSIDSIFGAIKTTKDERNNVFQDSYLSENKKREAIENTIKELQKIDGLRGKIKLRYTGNKKSAWLELSS